jgi:heptosyltransferase II
MPDPGRVLVIAPNWLGDAVMALPAVADVRRRFAAARLVVAARRSVAPLFEMVPGVDHVITLGWGGQPLRRAAFGADVARLAAEQSDVAILLPNSFGAAWLASRARVPERWGYGTDLRRPLLTRRAPRPRGSVHQARYYQHLVTHFGVDAGPLEPALVVATAAREAAHALLTARGWNGSRPIVAMAPGAAYGTAKRWLPRHFARLATDLGGTQQVVCVLVGAAGDRETARMVMGDVMGDVMGAATRPATGAAAPVIDLTGETTLHVLAGLLTLAHVCVSNDSGVMHLAAAAGVPVAALFGPTRDHETAPLPAAGGRVELLINPVWCRPCMLRECPIDHRCMRGLTPQRVGETVARLLAEPAR